MNAPASDCREFVVAPKDSRMRLDRFVASQVPEFSRVKIQKLIRAGSVLLNSTITRPREIVQTGDRVQLIRQITAGTFPPDTAEVTNQIVLSILFEDQDLIVLNKDPGVSIHPGAGKNSGTLVDALRAHSANLSEVGGETRPGIVHRLDKQTSGCLVVAKTDQAHVDLARQFAARTVEKIYLALVAGKLRKNAGTVEAPIGRHRVHRTKMAVAREGGRAARTDFRVIRSGETASLIECRLHSGRTHQIRVHLQHLGHPILGDTVYAARRAGDYSRQMLHALKLAFNHPRTKARLHFEAPVPQDFKEALRRLFAPLP
jgi:23S rRNA pseudouridine1911/1915/1917 synthase